ncbi:MAG: S1C family serine protease [bacterium]|nr:S1C family serine protease [bacterium]
MQKRRFLVLGLICLFSFVLSNLVIAQENLTELVKKVTPSVVLIETYNNASAIFSSGQGSGFFISGNGEVITNRHVLIGANRAEVKTADAKAYQVEKVLAEDTQGDLIRVSIAIGQNKIKPLSISKQACAVPRER